MGAPKHEIIQVDYQNPDATKGLKLNVLVISNTPDEKIQDNIRYSSKKYDQWLQLQSENDLDAIMIGGGSSVNHDIDEIKALQDKGGMVFAVNGASKWAREHDIHVDYQVILDAKEETHYLVDPQAERHLLASQCDKKTLEAADNLTLWHLAVDEVENYLPPERVLKGGYVIVGAGVSAGTTALCVAYTQGFRKLHIFGYDSSYHEGQSHAYPQPMNELMPTVNVEWGGKSFQTSVAMKAQAEKFGITATALKEMGCDLHLYGEGLLQTIYHLDPKEFTEREKYQSMWNFDAYRNSSPGEQIVNFYLDKFHPGRGATIIDYGCGTGRAGVIMREKGHDVFLIDFADNCRDEEAQLLPFLRHDLTEPVPVESIYGFCTDVMEHIPTDDVEAVIANVMDASEEVFFQISTIDDIGGLLIGSVLHLTVKPHEWWKDLFTRLGYTVEWDLEQDTTALFYIRR